MEYDPFFDSNENAALIAICTRKLISNIGIGGIIWGTINTLIGLLLVLDSFLYLVVVLLGLAMLGTGIVAVRKPSLNVLLAETAVTVFLFLTNLGFTILDFVVYDTLNLDGLILPLVISIAFGNTYRKLGHLREHIDSVEPEKIKTTKEMCKRIVKLKLKNEPSVVETTNRKCRAQLMGSSAFFIQRDLMRAFVCSREDVRRAIEKPDAKRLKLQFNHPINKLTYTFDKKSTVKLNDWLTGEESPDVAPSTMPAA